MTHIHPNFRPRIPTAAGLARYHMGEVFLPGAQAAVYEPAPPVIPAMTPIVNFSGAGILCGAAPSTRQGPQVYAFAANTLAGVGGLQAGTIGQQPLNVPETTNGTQ